MRRLRRGPVGVGGDHLTDLIDYEHSYRLRCFTLRVVPMLNVQGDALVSMHAIVRFVGYYLSRVIEFTLLIKLNLFAK